MVPLISWLQDGLTSFEPCSLFVVISVLKAPFRQKKNVKYVLFLLDKVPRAQGTKTNRGGKAAVYCFALAQKR